MNFTSSGKERIISIHALREEGDDKSAPFLWLYK